MSNASDRDYKAEDPSSFAPKWARDPALRERRPDAPRLAAGVLPDSNETADGPPIAPPITRRGADIADLRAARPAAHGWRQRAEDELPERAAPAEEDVMTDGPRLSRSLEP